MGNRFFSKSLRQTLIVITVALSFTLSALAGTNDDDEQKLRDVLSRIANVSSYNSNLSDRDLKILADAKYVDVCEILLYRLLYILDSFDRNTQEEANKSVVSLHRYLTFIIDNSTIQHNELLNTFKERVAEHREVYRYYKESWEKNLAEAEKAPTEHLKESEKKARLDHLKSIKQDIERSSAVIAFLDGLTVAAQNTQARNIQANIEYPSLERPIEAAAKLLEIRNTRYKSGKSMPVSMDEIYRKIYLDDVERIQNYLKRRIIGQSDAIDVLVNLETRKYVDGYVRTKPEVVLLAGLPGTGKDTTAENYVDAIHNREGAHEEHLFKFPVVNNSHEIWEILGSASGYVGSTGELKPIFHYLVKYSGGRYKIVADRSGAEHIEENEDWHRGQVLKGYFAPEDGVIFINEFHNWSTQAKDTLLKEFLEKGYIKVNSSNGGVKRLQVPITILIASNDGIGLLTPRDRFGKPTGKPKSVEELVAAWTKVKDKRSLIKKELQAKNGQSTGTGEFYGISEEVLNRIPERNVILLKPLTADEIQQIVQIKINSIVKTLGKGSGGFGSLRVQVSPELVTFIQAYNFEAEQAARPAEDKLNAVVEELYAAVRERQIVAGKVSDFYLDIKQNDDKTHSLMFKYGQNKTSLLFERVLKLTVSDQALKAIDFKEFDRLAEIPERLNEKIFGNKESIDQIGKAIAVSQKARLAYERNRLESKKATSFGLFGYAGLGKTQTAKEIAIELTGSEDFLLIDFTNIKNQKDLEDKLLGSRNGDVVIESDFMREYKRKDGATMVVLVEELANAHPELLRSLYPFFDEPEVRIFADGQARSMSNVLFLVTGNAGLEVYDDILKMYLPRDVKMAAMEWVYKEFIKDKELQFEILRKSVPVPLLTRFTDIFHFRPVNYEILRNLSQKFVNTQLKNLKAKDGVVGWDIGFRSEQDYTKFLEIVEREGFEFENQGRSVFNYVRKAIEIELDYLLTKNHIPNGTKIYLVPRNDQTDDVVTKNENRVKVDVIVEGRSAPLSFDMEAQERHLEQTESLVDKQLTAAHEAGHNIAAKVLLSDKMQAKYLSIVPGVGRVLNKMIYYLGVAVSEHKEKMQMTRQAVIEMIAVNAAGSMAQKLVTKGNVDDAGKRSDMEQSTTLARKAVMQWGLSPNFKKYINLESQSDILSLSENDKKIISKEIDLLLAEGEKLAGVVLKANSQLVIKLANVLLEKGEMKYDEIKEFYANYESLLNIPKNAHLAAQVTVLDRLTSSAKRLWNQYLVKDHNARILDGVTFTDKARDISDMVNEQKQAQLSKVKIHSNAAIFAMTKAGTQRLLTHQNIVAANSCRALFR